VSVEFRPDSGGKRLRYNASLAAARLAVSIVTDPRKRKGQYDSYRYTSIHTRRKRRLYENYETKRPYALNIQFKIRFFGMLHHYVSHGPVKAAKRWKQANLRFESVLPRTRHLSMRVYERRRDYL
jgi:hypothetical protein